MSILRLMLQTPIADDHSSRDKALDREDRSQLLASTASVLPMTTRLVSRPSSQQLEWTSNLKLMPQTPIADHHSSRDKALDREDGSQLLALEGKLDALVNLVTQLAANQKPTSVANDHHTIVCPSSQQSGFSARNDAIVIRGVHDVARDTSATTRKLEVKQDALVNLVTQVAANQKNASIARLCGIRSSNDHHTIVCSSAQQSVVDEHLEAYVANTYSRRPQSSRDKALDREDRSQLLAVQSARNDAISTASVLPMTTILVSVLLRSNLAWTSNLKLMLQTPIADHHSSRDKALDREDGSQLLALEGKLDALVKLVTQLAANQKPTSIAKVCGILSSNDHHTIVCPSSQQSGFSARNDVIVIRGVHDVARDTSATTRKLEVKLDALVNLVTQVAANQKNTSIARLCGIRSSNDHHTIVCSSAQQSGVDEHPEDYAANTYSRPPYATKVAIVIRGVHDVATDTSVETRKLEGNLDALVNLVTQLATNQKLASVARICGIHSTNDHHTSVCPSSQQTGLSTRNDAIVIRGVQDLATDTYAETRNLEGKLDALVNLVTQLAANQKPASVARVCGIRSSNDHHTNVCPSSQQLECARNDAIVIRGIQDVATYTSAETRKLEGKLDALVNLVTQLAANQKPTSVPIFSARNDAIVIRGVHDVSTDTSAETRKMEGKLGALVNLVNQLAENQSPAFVARVCGIRSSNDHHTSVCPSSHESVMDEHPEAYLSARNDAIVIRRVYDVVTDTSALTRKLEGKLDALVNLVTQLAANQKPASVARVCGIRSSNDHHTSVYSSSQQSGVDDARNDAIVIRGVHDVATDISTETRKLEASVLPMTTILVSILRRSNMEWMIFLRLMLQTPIADHHSSRGKALDREDGSQLLALEGKLDGLLNLVTQLAANQKPASVARVCGIRSSNDHHTIFSATNDAIVIRGVHDVATDTSAETRKLEGKLDALVNLVTQLAANQKLASIARICLIRSTNDHNTSLSTRNDAIVIRGVQDLATDTSAETRKLEGKLDALVNLVTQLAENQKPDSVARVCGIRSSNDHHTNFIARYDVIVIRGVHDVATDTSAETRKLEGKLDALVNLVTQLATNQKPASVARVCGIRSSNDHHTSDYPSSQKSNDWMSILRLMLQTPIADHHNSRDKALDREDGSQLLAVRYKNDAIVIRGVQDLATDTSAKTRKLKGKLDVLVNLVTQLAANQKLASVARVCDIRSSNDHHTNVCPSSQQSGVDEHPEAYAAKTYSRLPQQ
ncbi:hypothetical protein Fmac_032932 [Flemingia macrophylla]|uniref:Uncharacterized protein n=1 Tax=Flemingia macrophylla TaxID=520843 RepID=A0ABD1L6C7_9FABA